MTISPIFSPKEIAPLFASNTAILPNISWQTYEALLTDMGEHRNARLAYYHEVLEIRMPLELHEAINRILERLIITLTEELGLSIKSFGSTTFNRKDLAVGVEPDSCFYIQNAHLVRRFKIDIYNDPAPDLVVEVDLYSSSDRRFSIYQQLAAAEIWRYNKTGIKIYTLQDGEYLEQINSVTFPIISSNILDDFLQQTELIDDNELIRNFRKWVQQQMQQR
ncbi:Uma2 family endonuclease [Pseudanabaena sp. 'Roaring Creek']|uniref:Uma2 family endonuclease n=1 Tax=Pseudanabaena sp. 'Roaring Creek' TaxID=1681830 RepID=UPI0006D81865|nr:Uma2 family endonuclease [Pseudanabaena sp. 'Roaring Creek']